MLLKLYNITFSLICGIGTCADYKCLRYAFTSIEVKAMITLDWAGKEKHNIISP